jgi:hypothetical protein
MGVSHREFWQSLPAAVAGRDYVVDGDRVTIGVGGGTVVLTLGPERTRRIAALSLPATVIELRFDGVGEDDRTQFLRRFDIGFQRGGG